eukprot:m.40623 g.40623  ORF g.40623 m.40623 type:complete len:294 (+) comp10451_c0_seq1:1002-1883(+)
MDYPLNIQLSSSSTTVSASTTTSIYLILLHFSSCMLLLLFLFLFFFFYDYFFFDSSSSCFEFLVLFLLGITGLGMIDRGRNIVSSSRDGSIKLWDCGTATCIATLSVSSEPVHDMALLNAPALAQQEGHNPPHEHEVETQGHVVVACTSDNAVLCDVRARSTVQTAEFASPFACLSPSASMGGMGLVTGHETGHVCMWDMRQLSTPVSVYQQWEARITSISATSPYNATFMASTNEGTCFGVDLETCTSTLLTGPELDPLTQLTATEELLATSCRDGAVRFYKSNPHPVVDQL